MLLELEKSFLIELANITHLIFFHWCSDFFYLLLLLSLQHSSKNLLFLLKWSDSLGTKVELTKRASNFGSTNVHKYLPCKNLPHCFPTFFPPQNKSHQFPPTEPNNISSPAFLYKTQDHFLFVLFSQANPLEFWNGVNWRLMFKYCIPKIANLRG